jgi:hypothetical protein
MKRRIVATLAIPGIMSLPSPAFASHGEPAYIVHYYSDASQTVEVGTDYPTCYYFGVGYSHSGQATNYSWYEHVGYCAEMGWEDL